MFENSMEEKCPLCGTLLHFIPALDVKLGHPLGCPQCGSVLVLNGDSITHRPKRKGEKPHYLTRTCVEFGCGCGGYMLAARA